MRKLVGILAKTLHLHLLPAAVPEEHPLHDPGHQLERHNHQEHDEEALHWKSVNRYVKYFVHLQSKIVKCKYVSKYVKNMIVRVCNFGSTCADCMHVFRLK